MAVRVKSFRTGFELQQFLETNNYGYGAIISIINNQSGFAELIYEAGRFTYATGSGATTVQLPAGSTLSQFSALANGGAVTITVGTLPTINIPNGASFTEDALGRVIGPVDIVFTGPADYYVSWFEEEAP